MHRTNRLLPLASLAALLVTAGCDRPVTSAPATTAAKLVAPAARTFKADKLAAMDAAVEAAIAAKQIPGGVLWLERDGEVYKKAYGRRALVPAEEPTTEDTIYDAASVTKVMATTTAVMRLVEQGKLDLDAPVARCLPAFAQNGKDGVTVRHLLTHTSGLRSGIPATPPWSGADVAIARACAEELRHAPGSAFLYSDINFVLLSELVRLASGRRLDVFAQEEIFSPLQLRDTCFFPPPDKLGRVAPTEPADGQMLRGVVHDPTAQRMGGVGGSAGLFTTAADLARFCRMLLNGGELDGARILRADTVAAMTRPQMDGSDRRGLGWDIDSSYSGPRGRWFPAGRSFGHTGWTGTSVWIDPAARTFVIFLSNRVHPDGKGDAKPVRALLATLAAEAVGRDAGAVLNGIDVLVRDEFAPLRGLKIGLITNQSGRDRQNRTTIDLLHAAKDVQLVALFSPEHGIRGTADAHVGDTVDEKTKLPVYSLYGDTPKRTEGMSPADYDLAVIRSRAPKPEQLAELDALVFDIQDVGARFYTYSATLGAAVEAVARAKKKIFVLDRVNPIGGARFEGPVQTRAASFIGFHPVPVRHGLTLGEFARLVNLERGLGADLTVIRCENWSRTTWFDDTGLPWTNPSPSMRSLTAATLYPGLCLLESTTISMGRGTIRPFEQVGAPFVDGEKLAAEMNAARLPGVRFEAVKFTPCTDFYSGPANSLKYRDQECGGVRVHLVDREACLAVDLGIQLALVIQRLYSEQLSAAPALEEPAGENPPPTTAKVAGFKTDAMSRLLGDEETLNAIRANETLAQIKSRWTAGLARYAERIQPAMLYSPGFFAASDLQALVDRAARTALDTFRDKKLLPTQLAITLVDLRDPARPPTAGFRGDVPIYPASVIKLFYLAAVHRWLEDGRLTDTPELRRAMRDMIVDSSNDATSYLIDLLTGTTSGPELPEPELKTWFEQRNAVNRYFAALGYTGINANKKPWGDGPYGRETQAARAFVPRRNMLTTDGTARLLTEIVAGRCVTAARSAEMLQLMARDLAPKDADPDNQARFTGPALPAGAKLWSKAGWTSQTRHDAVYVELPNGAKFILVVFTTDHANEREIIRTVAKVVVDGLSAAP
jgi:uncharacterized protein YbbC (DUF1343 family)/CubicO group peptidase (beta-lactamase class C family)/beta-lactamase class A